MTELAAHKAESVAVSAEAAAATRLTTDRLAPQEGYVRLCSLSVPEIPYASRHCGSGTAANPAHRHCGVPSVALLEARAFSHCSKRSNSSTENLNRG